MNKNIIDYRILTDSAASRLTRSVLEYITQGWQPLESAKFIVDSNLGNIYFMQTMVKYQEDSSNH